MIEKEEKSELNVSSRSHFRFVVRNFRMRKRKRMKKNQSSKHRSRSVSRSGFVPRRRLELPHLAAYAPQAYLYTIPTPGHVILPENDQDKH